MLSLLGDGGVHFGFVAIPLTLTNHHGLAVLGCIITSTPGTIWVSYDPIGNMLLIHVLDLVDEQTWIDTLQQRYERPLLEIVTCATTCSPSRSRWRRYCCRYPCASRPCGVCAG